MYLKKNYYNLIDNLELLSSSYEKQRQSLPDFADAPDDIVSLFEDSFLLIPEMIENNMLTNDAIAWIVRTYNLMKYTIRNVGLDAFDGEDWNKVREFAKKTLEHIQ